MNFSSDSFFYHVHLSVDLNVVLVDVVVPQMMIELKCIAIACIRVGPDWDININIYSETADRGYKIPILSYKNLLLSTWTAALGYVS